MYGQILTRGGLLQALAYAAMEAKKPLDVPSASWRTKKASDAIQVLRLRNGGQGGLGYHPGPRWLCQLKKRKNKSDLFVIHSFIPPLIHRFYLLHTLMIEHKLNEEIPNNHMLDGS